MMFSASIHPETFWVWKPRLHFVSWKVHMVFDMLCYTKHSFPQSFWILVGYIDLFLEDTCGTAKPCAKWILWGFWFLKGQMGWDGNELLVPTTIMAAIKIHAEIRHRNDAPIAWGRKNWDPSWSTAWPSPVHLMCPDSWVLQLRISGCLCTVDDREVLLFCEFQSSCNGLGGDSGLGRGIGRDGLNIFSNTGKGRGVAVR